MAEIGDTRERGEILKNKRRWDLDHMRRFTIGKNRNTSSSITGGRQKTLVQWLKR